MFLCTFTTVATADFSPLVDFCVSWRTTACFTDLSDDIADTDALKTAFSARRFLDEDIFLASSSADLLGDALSTRLEMTSANFEGVLGSLTERALDVVIGVLLSVAVAAAALFYYRVINTVLHIESTIVFNETVSQGEFVGLCS